MIQRAFLLSLALVATTAATPPPPPVPAASAPAPAVTNAVAVAGGTSVVVALTEPLSSATANVGDQVSIVVKKEVDVNGWIVIPEGANGHATVTTADRAHGNGSGGKLALSMDWVTSADGGKIKLSQTNHASENGDQKGASSTATIATYVLLGPLGLFAHNFVRGKDVTIDTNKTFTVFVDQDVHVVATQHATQAPGFDH